MNLKDYIRSIPDYPKEDFYRDAATTDKPRTILGLGGTDRNSLIADGKDKKLRDSVIVTVHTRNIGETF